ncbi:MAG: ABC transporter permease [Nocardioidaceae bacterium]
MTNQTAEIVAPHRSANANGIILKALSAVMPIATIVMMTVFAANTNAFLTISNLLAVAEQNAAVFIIATAFAMLLMAGYVDLSVGSVMALCGVVAGVTFNNLGVVPGVLLAIAVGIGVGVLNGILIGIFDLSPIVVTLGGLAAARGVAQAIAPDSIFGFPSAIRKFGSGDLIGVPYTVWLAVLVAALGIFVMSLTPVGKHILAVGVNPRAAYLVGIPVKRLILGLYVSVGLATSVSGIVMVARLDSAPSGTLGVGFEVTVLTAVLLGGIPFIGGRGSLWRVLLGVWFIAVLKNGLTLMNVGPEVASVISGSVLVIAAGLEAVQIYLRKRL